MALKESDRNRKMTWPGKSNCVQEKRDQNTFAKNLARPEPPPRVNGGMNKYGKQVSFQWNHPLPGSTSVSVTSPSPTSTTVVSTSAPRSMDRPRPANVSQPPPKQNRKTVEVHLKELGIPPVDKIPSKVTQSSTRAQDLQELLSTLESSPRPSPSGKDRPTMTTTPSLPKTVQQHKAPSEPLRITPQEPSSSRQKVTNPQQESRGETTITQTDRRPREAKPDGPGSRVTLVQITMPNGNAHMPPSNVKTSQTITPTTMTVSAQPKMLMPRDAASSTQQCATAQRPIATPRGRPPQVPRSAPPENRSSKNDSQRTDTANTKPPKQATDRQPMPMIAPQRSQATPNKDRRQYSSNSPIEQHNLSTAEKNAINSRQEKFGTTETSMRSNKPNREEPQRNSSLQPMIPNQMRPTTTDHTPPQHHQSNKNDTLDSQYPHEREPAQVNNWSTSSAGSRSPSPLPQQLRSVPAWQRRRIRYVRRRQSLSPAIGRRNWPVLQMSPAAYREDRRRIMNAQAQEEWKWGMSSRCFGQRSLSLVTQGVLVPVRQSNYLQDDGDRSTASLGSTVALMSMEREMKSVPDVDDAWEESVAGRGEADRCVQYTELAEHALAKTNGRRGRMMIRPDERRFTDRERLLRRKEAEVERRKEELLAREQDLDALADNLDQRYHNITRCHKAFHRALQHSCFEIENEESEMKTKFLRRSRFDLRRLETNDGGEAAARTLHLILRYADERMLERLRVGIAYALAFYACEYDLPHLLRELYQKLDVGTDLRDKRGFTLLHAAAARGAVRAAKVLLFEMGANIWETTTSGTSRGGVCEGGVKLTAMDLAQAGGYENMVRFLEDVNYKTEMVESGDGRQDDEGATCETMGGGKYADGFERCDGKWQRDHARRPSHRRLRSLSNFFHSDYGPAKRFKGAWYPFVAESSAWGDDYEYF